MATRTARAQAQEKAAETKRRSRQPVAVRHVQPVRPVRESFPAGVEGTRAFREAEGKYETALLAYAAEVGAPADIATDYHALEQFFTKGDTDRPGVEVVSIPVNATPAEVAKAAEEKPRRRRPPVEREDQATANGGVEERRSPKKAPAKSTPKEPKSTSKPKAAPKKAPALPAPDGYRSWTDPKLATAVVRMKTKEKKTIKEIAEALRLPAEHRSWFAVSKVWRETADAKGLDRQRLSPEAIEARKAKRAAK
jgi:hypothetical protein